MDIVKRGVERVMASAIFSPPPKLSIYAPGGFVENATVPIGSVLSIPRLASSTYAVPYISTVSTSAVKDLRTQYAFSLLIVREVASQEISGIVIERDIHTRRSVRSAAFIAAHAESSMRKKGAVRSVKPLDYIRNTVPPYTLSELKMLMHELGLKCANGVDPQTRGEAMLPLVIHVAKRLTQFSLKSASREAESSSDDESDVTDTAETASSESSSSATDE